MTTAIYVRVSTNNQDSGIASQLMALREYCQNHGIDDVTEYHDQISGAKDERPGLDKLQRDIFMGRVRTVIVWKLDRLARNMAFGVKVMSDWLEKDVRLISITEQFDFSGTVGKMVSAMLLSFAEMEREQKAENIKRGLDARKAAGLKLGKPKGAGVGCRTSKRNQNKIIEFYHQGLSISHISDSFSVSRQTIYRILDDHDIERSKPIDTKLIVRDNEKQGWEKAHFYKFENEVIHCFKDGFTSWTIDDYFCDTSTWIFAELANGEGQIEQVKMNNYKIDKLAELTSELIDVLKDSDATFDNIDKKRFMEIDNGICDL